MPDAMRDLVPAVGGTRLVPRPDPIAADYLRLALRLDQHRPGLVDGYLGPAELKAEVDLAQLRSPARLRDDAAELRARLSGEVDDPVRRAWLDAQLGALETQAEVLAGAPRPYLEQVERYLGQAPVRREDAEFDAAAARIDALLPGNDPLAQRLEAWDARFEIAVDRLPAVADWLLARFRERAVTLFGLPDGEDVRVSLVTGQPWSGYCWFDGGRRSRVELNTDLPVRAPSLVHVLAHETYPGHHLEHAWKEALLVDEAAHLEASILLINTPECLISEGLADLGHDFAVPAEDAVPLLIDLFDRAALPFASDAAAARATAETCVALETPRRTLAAIRGEAAIRRHAEGRSHEDVLDYLQSVGRYDERTAAKRLEFVEHPLWQTYVFVYADGEALLRRWLDGAPADERTARFGRLLREPLTPAMVRGAG